MAGKIKKWILKLQRRFPQLIVQVAMHHFPTDHPFSMHAFWLFNAGAFSGEAKRGSNNHAILIAIDPSRKESAIVTGYGLEALLRQEALDHLLEMSGPAFESNNWEVGMQLLFEGLEDLLETVSVAVENFPAGGNEF